MYNTICICDPSLLGCCLHERNCVWMSAKVPSGVTSFVVYLSGVGGSALVCYSAHKLPVMEVNGRHVFTSVIFCTS